MAVAKPEKKDVDSIRQHIEALALPMIKYFASVARNLDKKVGINKDENGFVKCEFDGITYIIPAWQEMGDATFDLARKINESGENIDLIVALAKGGWTWARTLADNLAQEELASVRIRFYVDIGKTTGEPEITQLLAVDVTGKDILLLDEVIDSGETMKKAIKYLFASGAKSVRVATLCYKPKSIVVPDFYSFMTEAWVVFPHEIRETIVKTTQTWIKNGHSLDEVKKRFQEMGLPSNQVAYFLSQIDTSQH